MLERIQKPFLTVETGQAYQPIRLTYELPQKTLLAETLNKLQCLEKHANPQGWSWYWRNECEDLHFESLDSFLKNCNLPIRLGTITLRDSKLYLSLPSFKRACLAVPFFYRLIDKHVAKVH